MAWLLYDHKVLYTYQTLSEMLQSVGFQVDLLEHYEESGTFHHAEWILAAGVWCGAADGPKKKVGGDVMQFTSLIVDARKP